MIQFVLMVLHLGSVALIDGSLKRGDFSTMAWLSAAEVNAWYYSRKKLEVEIENQKAGESHAFLWAIGWWPGSWDKYKRLDWILPTATAILVAMLYQTLGI